MSRKKKIARISETRVKEWAEKNDAAVNSSDPDEFGWDHYIEFESTVYHETLTGLHTSPIKCKAQIKATDSDDGNRQLSLSSLKHVATDANPAFIVFIEYKKKNSPQKVYVTHIEEDISYQILSRCAKTKNKGKKLNKSTYKIPDKYRNEIMKPFGKNLINYIKENIGSSMENYQRNKMEYLSNMGFENGKISATFSINDVDKAIKQSLYGSEQYIKVDTFHHTIKRFGITENPEELNKGELWLKLIAKNDPISAKFYVEKDDGIGELEFNVNLISAVLNQFIPDRKQLILMESSCFEVTFNPFVNDGQLTITERLNYLVSIHELVKYFYLIKIISATKDYRKIRIEINTSEDNETKVGNLKVGELGDKIDVSQEIEALERIINICSNETNISNVRISLEEFRQNFDHIKGTFEKYETITKNVHGDKLRVELLEDVERSDTYSVLINLVCPVGDHFFTSLITVSSLDISDADENEILLNDCKVDVHFQDLLHNQKTNALYRSKIIEKAREIGEKKYKEGYMVISPQQNLALN